MLLCRLRRPVLRHRLRRHCSMDCATRSTHSSGVRVRFAPSPTGALHIGGLRTALFNKLLAARHGGSFVLRIEDTDANRLVPGSQEGIIDLLQWAGLSFDEGPTKGGPYGPYVQSERLPIYREHADTLVASGHAYRCFCTPERLADVRAAQVAAGEHTVYDGHCRGIPAAEAEARAESGEAHVVRLRATANKATSACDANEASDSGEVIVHDALRGGVSFPRDQLDDAVLIKMDGRPTYHLASVVDDHLMRITHVIRGDEWLSSAPKHALLYAAFGWTPPSFVHVPLLLNTDRSKLSKRHAAVSVESYRDAGYAPEALVNFVGLLGWSPPHTEDVATQAGTGTGTGKGNGKGKSKSKKDGERQEVWTMDQMSRVFDLEQLNVAPSVVDTEKLNWLNGQHAHRLVHDADGRVRLHGLVCDALDALGLPLPLPSLDAGTVAAERWHDHVTPEYVSAAWIALGSRISLPSDLATRATYVFVSPDLCTDEARQLREKCWKGPTVEVKTGDQGDPHAVPGPPLHNKGTAALLLDFAAEIGVVKAAPDTPRATSRDMAEEAAAAAMKTFCKGRGVGTGKLMLPLRYALTGSRVGPTVSELIALLGPQEVVLRIHAAVDFENKED